VPAEIRRDPDLYEAYAREQFDAFVAGRGDQGPDGARPSGSRASEGLRKRLSGFKMSSLLDRMSRNKGRSQRGPQFDDLQAPLMAPEGAAQTLGPQSSASS